MLGYGLGAPALALRTAGVDEGWEAGFAQGLYRFKGAAYGDEAAFRLAAGATFARSGSGTARGLNERLAAFGDGVPRLTDRGLLIEGARSNKVTLNTANPVDVGGLTRTGDAAAVLSVVGDAAALATAGLDGVCTSGRVFRLDNSAGSGNASVFMPGVAGNTSLHALSVYARTSGGSGAVLRLENFSGSSFSFSGATYGRRSVTTAVDDAARKLMITAGPGVSVWFILPQMEEAQTPGSVIVASGGAGATMRGGDLWRLDQGLSGDFTDHGEVELGAAPGEQTILALDDGTTANGLTILRTAAGVVRGVVRSGGVETVIGEVARPGARPLKWAAARAGGVWRLAVDGESVGGAVAGAGVLTARFVGSGRGGGAPLNGYVRRIGHQARALTATEMAALTG